MTSQLAAPRREGLEPGLVRRQAPFHLLKRNQVGVDLVDDRGDPGRVPHAVYADGAMNVVGSDY